MVLNPNFEQIGNEFIKHYYHNFDESRAANLADLYDAENSFFTFEQFQCNGKAKILEKISSLPFQSIKRAVTTVDCQPLTDGSICVSVVGQLKTDNDPINSYSHFFILKQNPAGSFYIGNEIFRLVIHN